MQLPGVIFLISQCYESASEFFLKSFFVDFLKRVSPRSDFSFSEGALVVRKIAVTKRIVLVAVATQREFFDLFRGKVKASLLTGSGGRLNGSP